MNHSDAATARPVEDRYSDLPVLQPARPTASRSRHEYVCIRCERGQCARCTDRACTCCYGNEG